MKIAIVILNWNGKALLQKYLPDIVRYSPTEYSDIYVIDNCSTDDSVAYIRQHFTSVKVIENPENGGYARGYNVGLAEIQADIFGLVNSDIEVTQGWLEPIKLQYEKQPETAIIQPKIRDANNKAYFEYAGAAGGFIDQLGYPYCRGRIFDEVEKDEGQYDQSTPIFWASGACIFIKKDVFWTLGALDEKYFAHQEEIDLSWRAFNKGYLSQYVPESVVYHVGGATLSHVHWKKTFLNFRNSLFNLVKNAPATFPVLIFFRLILDGIAGLKFLLEGKFRHTLAIIQAHFSFYAHIPYLLKKRSEIKIKSHKYYTIRSIVWQYFIKNKRRF